MADRTKGLILWTLAMVMIAVAVSWLVFLARGALLIVYVSVLLSIGFGPIVRTIERHPVKRGDRALPRWLAILVVYLVFVAALTITGFLVIPPLVDQAQELWRRLPSMLDAAQNFLINRGLMNHRITLEEAVRNAPGTPRARPRGGRRRGAERRPARGRRRRALRRPCG